MSEERMQPGRIEETETARDVYVLRWTPTVSDLEQVIGARRRATKVVWIDRALGVGIALLAVSPMLVRPWSVAILPEQLLMLVLLLVGLLIATGLWGRIYRALFTWRADPSVGQPVEDVVDRSGIRSSGAGRVEHSDWSVWTSLIVLPDIVALFSSPRGNARAELLHRRGLDDPARWDDLVEFVTAHVARG